MSPRRSATIQEPLPAFTGEVKLAVQARTEAKLLRIEHKRERSRKRSRRYRAKKRA